jgi:chemotaxis protein CheY-P-specific phosphatase CheC/CheY-like chemotaxis protein
MAIPVLICDDSSVARKLMTRSLPSDWDIDICYALNGREALDQLKAGKGDILFLDLNMPVMDGYETLEAILKNNLQTSVLVVSGDIQPEAYSRVMALGAVAFIKKPIGEEKLADILQELDLYESTSASTTNSNNAIIGGRSNQEIVAAGPVQYRDCIQEIANVAIGQSADLLARLLNVFIKLPVPNVNVLEVCDLKMALSHVAKDDTYSAVCQGFIGAGIAGEALLIFSDSSYSDMAKLLKYEGELNDNAELELIMDIASILVGACTGGIADQLNISFSQGHPVVLGQHVDIGELVASNESRWKETLAIEIIYEIENYNITCDLLLLFTEDSIDNLNRRLSYLMD